MDFEEILTHIGKFGPFQWRVYLVLCCISLVTPFHLFSQVFFAKPVDHWCYDSSIDALNCSVLNVSDGMECIEAKRNLYIPRTANGDGFEKCQKYQLDGYLLGYDGADANTSVIAITGCDEGWVYDPRVPYGYSIISDFELFCHRKSLPQIAMSIFFFTIMIGVVLIGWISDRIGRLYTILIMSVVLCVSGSAVCIVKSFWAYVIIRSICGPCIVGLFSVPFVLGAELVSSENRILTGFVIEYFFAIGYVLTAVLAEFIQNWRFLQLTLTLPALLIIASIPLIVESPRWLLSRGHNKRALKIIKQIAKGNRKKMPDISLEPTFSQKKVVDEKISMREIFRHRTMVTRTLILMVAWFTNNIVYMVISFSAGGFGVNVIVGSLLLAAVEIPANTIAMVTVKYLGRRYPQCCMFFTAGAASILSRFIPIGGWQIAVVVVSKLAISASFNTIFVYTAELYPTSVRGFSLSICSMMARVGGTIFPFILLLADFWQHFPLVISGILAVISGIGILLLPETKMAALPATIEDALYIGRKRIPVPTSPGDEEKTNEL